MNYEVSLSCKIYNTDEYMFICKEKVASTLLESMFYNTETEGGMVFNYQIDLETKKLYPIKNYNNQYQQKTIQDFDDCLTKNSDKKIILLYRNPLKRLQSAIVQDFNSVINDYSEHEFTLKLLFELLNSNQYTRDFIMRNRGSLYLTKLENELPEIEKFFIDAFKLYIKHLSESNFSNQHGQNYLYNFYSLVNNDYFNLSNLILCDIDEPNNLDSLLKQINITVDNNRKNSNNHFRKMIELASNNNTVLQKVESKLKIENEFYSLFKIHLNNFKK